MSKPSRRLFGGVTPRPLAKAPFPSERGPSALDDLDPFNRHQLIDHGADTPLSALRRAGQVLRRKGQR